MHKNRKRIKSKFLTLWSHTHTSPHSCIVRSDLCAHREKTGLFALSIRRQFLMREREKKVSPRYKMESNNARLNRDRFWSCGENYSPPIERGNEIDKGIEFWKRSSVSREMSELNRGVEWRIITDLKKIRSTPAHFWPHCPHAQLNRALECR